MHDVQLIMKELESMGSTQTKKTLINHGAPEHALFGVKVGDMKKIVKRVKKDYQLAIDLFKTGNADAQYLAGLIGDESKMTAAQLNEWAAHATWHMISEYAVPFVAAESPLGWTLATQWMQSDIEKIAACGWSTATFMISAIDNESLPMVEIKSLLNYVVQHIHQAENRVRYTQNAFIIAVGSYIPALHTEAVKAAQTIGNVSVNVGKTACKVPLAADYIQKVVDQNKVGHKRKAMRC